MNRLAHISILEIVNFLTAALTVASIVRVILYRLPDLLHVWISSSSKFWLGYAKLVESCDVILGWISGALAKYGKSDLLSTEHLEYLRDKTPAPPPPPAVEPIPVLDAAQEEPKEPDV